MITADTEAWRGVAFHEPKTSLWRRYGDWSGVGALMALLGLMQLIPAHRQMLHADDPALQFPYVSDETFPNWCLVVLAIVLPIALFVLIFVIKVTRAPNCMAYAKFELHRLLLSFCFAIVLTLVLTDFGKRLVGRPRPNSVAMSGYQPDGSYDASSHRVAEAFLSFPSGHSSLAFSGFVFLSLYMFHSLFPVAKYRDDEGVGRPWKLLACALPLVLAGWIAGSRLTDYWHHPSDVLAGSILGALVSRIVFYTQFHCYRHKFSSLAQKRLDTTPLINDDLILPIEDSMSQA